MQNENTSNALADFLNFAKDFRIIFGYIIGLGGAPWLLEYVFKIGPPWPGPASVSAFTSIVIWLTLFWSFTSWEKIQQIELTKLVRRFCIIAFIMLCFYALFTTWFVKPASDSQDFKYREAVGFILRDQIIQVMIDNPDKTVDKLFYGAGYDPFMIWKAWTVNLTRSGILILWFFLFGSLSFVISVFILHQYQRQVARVTNSEEISQPKTSEEIS